MPNQRETGSTIAPAKQGLESILGEIGPDDLKPLAVAVIQEHRLRVEAAEELFSTVRQLEEAGELEELKRQRHHYQLALLNVHGQHQLVSTLVKALGYVPDIDSATTTKH